VLIAADEQESLARLRSALSIAWRIDIIGEAASGASAVDAAATLHPDVVVLHLGSSDMSVDASRSVRERAPDSRVIIVFPGYPSDEDVAHALSAGVVGYILERDVTDLPRAAKTVGVEGKSYVSFLLGGAFLKAGRLVEYNLPPGVRRSPWPWLEGMYEKFRQEGRALRVLIAVDDPEFAGWLRSGLSGADDIDIAGEAVSADDAVAASRTLRPDVMFLDIGESVMTTLRTVAKLHDAAPETKIVAFVPPGPQREVAEAVGALRHLGIDGCLVRKMSDDDVGAIAWLVLAGEQPLHPELYRAWLFGMDPKPGDPRYRLQQMLLRVPDEHLAALVETPLRKDIQRVAALRAAAGRDDR